MLHETDTGFQKFVVNHSVNFRLACNAYKVELHASKSGVCFCPFHYNKNTPSAKVYDSGLYCFSENKCFYVSDLIEYGLIDDSIQNIFTNIWNILTNTKKEEFVKKYESFSDDMNYKALKKEFLPLLDYKRNKISYSDYCDRLYSILQNMSLTIKTL